MEEGKTYKHIVCGGRGYGKTFAYISSALKDSPWIRGEVVANRLKWIDEMYNPYFFRNFMVKKKMTKTEAFEYLKNRKIYVNGKSAEIQKILFKAGFSWDWDKTTKYEGKPFIFTYEEALFHLTHSSDMTYFRNHKNTEISAEEILAIEIQEEKPKHDEELYKLAQPIREYMRKHNISGRLVVSQCSITVEDLRFIYPNNPED